MTTVTISFRLGNNAQLRSRVLPKVDTLLRTLGCKNIAIKMINS
jgi:hypothetical protein